MGFVNYESEEGPTKGSYNLLPQEAKAQTFVIHTLLGSKLAYKYAIFGFSRVALATPSCAFFMQYKTSQQCSKYDELQPAQSSARATENLQKVRL